MADNCFIVGIKTPEGDYTYHYHKYYWLLFNVREMEYAPEWDGHLPSDVDRLKSLIKKED
jgi:FPC/CPF motif-containing protein YcgG